MALAFRQYNLNNISKVKEFEKTGRCICQEDWLNSARGSRLELLLSPLGIRLHKKSDFLLLFTVFYIL